MNFQGSISISFSLLIRINRRCPGEFWNEAEDWTEDVDDLLVSVVLVVTVVGKGKVFGDLWGVWLRIDVEAEENEVGLHGDEEVVGDENV